MGYLSLYRKWRPQFFRDVVGQEHITRTLQNALASGRTAHAYLFTGPRGTGKTTVAKVLAKALNCEKGPAPEPCDECESCRAIRAGTSMDVLEIDGASNRGIDEVRDLREKVKFAPAHARFKVYIIDEVHMLTTEAFNALLKTLEEPPAHVVFIFATTEPHKVPATILSRCQRFDFHRLSYAAVRDQLLKVAGAEGMELDAEAAGLLARYADGGMRDALSLLDQCLAYAAGKPITRQDILDLLGVVGEEELARLARSILSYDAATSLAILEETAQAGKDLVQVTRDLVAFFRDLLLVRALPDSVNAANSAPGARPAQLSDLLHLDATALALRRELAALAPPERFLQVLSVLGTAEGELRRAGRTRLPLEVALVRLSLPGSWTEERTAARKAEANPGPLETGNAPPRPGRRGPAGPAEQEPASVSSLSGAHGAGAHGGRQEPDGRAPAAGGDQHAAIWEQFLAGLESQQKRTLRAHYAQGGRLMAFDGHRFWVQFRAPFHRDAASHPDNLRSAEQVLQHIAGHKVELVLTLPGEPRPDMGGGGGQPGHARAENAGPSEKPAEEPGPAPAGDEAPRKGPPPQDEAVRAARQLFGDDLVVVDP